MAEKRVEKIDPTPVTFAGSGGITLSGDAWGAPEAPLVLFLHGGGQTRWAWVNAARAVVARGWSAITLDARGHGESDWAPDGAYNMTDFADDYVAVAQSLPQRPVVVGASLGGITSMLAEGTRDTHLARAIVLVDIAPRMEPEGVERILSFMGAHPEGFATVDEAADAVSEYLTHRPRPKDTTGLAKNLRWGEDGRYRWHWDPRMLETWKSPPQTEYEGRYDRAAEGLQIPTLLVRGGSSDIVSEDSVKHFLDLVPHGQYTDVSQAGHMVAGDRNDAFNAAVLRFLEQLETDPGDA